MEDGASLRDGVATVIILIPWEPAELEERVRLKLERFAIQRGSKRDHP
jgi:hypothetical protein